jgi:hypothetical protein
MTGPHPGDEDKVDGEIGAPIPAAGDSGARPVLGLFWNEAGLRDQLALNLDIIEPGLELLKVEYTLDNNDGSGGRIDILARDRFDHVVCIEVKRSDQSARAALNELSKYVTLLYERDRVPREVIRCIVVSTHWSELLLPLSYFAASSGVDVVALKAVARNGILALEPVELRPLRFLPQLCPAMYVAWFDEPAVRDRYVDLIKARSGELPFMRLALLLLEPGMELDAGRSPFAVVECVWRAPDARISDIEQVTDEPIGSGFPYAAQGWDAELDALGWIDDVLGEVGGESGFSHATSESLRNMLGAYRVAGIERVGDWPKLEFINGDDRIMDAVLSRSPLGGSERQNRHSFDALVTPAVQPSWRAAVSAFLAFISFEPVWRDEAEGFLDGIPDTYEVHLHAFDKKHFFYAVHQARARPESMLSYFTIEVTLEGAFISSMVGYYRWDGATVPSDAREAIETVYGSLHWGRLAIGSAVDDQRYEAALALHGFTPDVDVFVSEDDLVERGGVEPGGTKAFVEAHPAYAQRVSELLEAMGTLPTDPSA